MKFVNVNQIAFNNGNKRNWMRHANQIHLSQNRPKQPLSLLSQFQMESNHYEMKLFFQTALFSLDITHYVDSMVIHCFYDPLNFVPKYFQNALIEIVQICPNRGREEGYKVP